MLQQIREGDGRVGTRSLRESLSSPLATHPRPEKVSKRVPFPAQGSVNVFWKKGCFLSTIYHYGSQTAEALIITKFVWSRGCKN